MNGFVLTDVAQFDLFEIWAFVASDHLEAADKLEVDLLQACGRLAAHPAIGHRRRDLSDNPSIRFHAVRTWYLIVYELGTQPLNIIRILHGARDAKNELMI